MNIKYKNHIKESKFTEEETTVLSLANEGEVPFKAYCKEEYEILLKSLNNRDVKIHLPWFWTHEIKKEFTKSYASKLDMDSLHYIILKTENLCSNRELHWIEKTNFFHLYGLCRVAGFSVPQDSWANNFPAKTPLAFSSLSASNSMLIQNRADAKDSIRSINIIRESNMHRAFSEYQLYYYGGLDHLISNLIPYLGSYKESVIPTSLYAITNTFIFSDDLRDRLYGELVDKLPVNAQVLIGDLRAFKS